MIVRLGHALDEVRRWQEEQAAHGRHLEARAAACGWQVSMIGPGSGYSGVRVARLRAEPFVIDGGAFDPDSLAHTLPVRAVMLPTKRYAQTRTVHAHPLDAALLEANATEEAPVVAESRRRVLDIAGLRRFWHKARGTSAKRCPIGGLRRFWRLNAAVRVTVTIRTPGIALDHENRTVYVDAPGPWWVALEAEGVTLSVDLVREWAALRETARTSEDIDRLDWLWARMSSAQRVQANDRLFELRARAG